MVLTDKIARLVGKVTRLSAQNSYIYLKTASHIVIYNFKY